jgi:hypothetical protein
MTIQARAAVRTAYTPRAGRLMGDAGVVELVDTPALGAGGLTALGVRVPSPAFGLHKGVSPAVGGPDEYPFAVYVPKLCSPEA